ncbi:MAG: hypothetical protein J6A37_06990 [Oscillospiraceae bacterium]|nr:hypothetical protein [Oscillospiraceae bacterium]
MIKLVIKGKVIEFIRVLHMSVDGGNFVIYGDVKDGCQKDHILFFNEDDIDELNITQHKI